MQLGELGIDLGCIRRSPAFRRLPRYRRHTIRNRVFHARIIHRTELVTFVKDHHQLIVGGASEPRGPYIFWAAMPAAGSRLHPERANADTEMMNRKFRI